MCVHLQCTRIVLELWAIGSDVYSTRVNLFAVGDGTEVLHWSCDEGGTRALHPTTAGHVHFVVEH